MLQDIRFALRYWRRHPAFAATAISLLALAIAANAVLFSAADTLLLKPLPVRDPDRLVRVVELRPKLPAQTWYSPKFLELLQQKSTTLDSVFGGMETDAALTGKEAEPVRAMVISPNYFAALGVGPQLGRYLETRDDASGEFPAVLSHAFWVRKFAADRGMVGRTLSLGGQTFRIVGVMPPGFHGVQVETSPEIWVPRSGAKFTLARNLAEGDGTCCIMELAARLRPGVSLETASQELRGLWIGFVDAAGGSVEDREFFRRQPVQLQSIRNGVSLLRERFGVALRILLAASIGLLLIACANVAGLLLSSAAARRRETSIRLAIGATSGRLAAQWITEALLLTMASAVAGVVIAFAVLPLLPAMLPPLRNLQTSLLQVDLELTVDPRLLAYTIAAALVCTLLVAASPAIQVLSGRSGSLERVSAIRTMTTRRILVGTQVALCTVLLIGATLLVQSVRRLAATPTGMDAAHITGFTVRPGLRHYTNLQTASLAERLAEGGRAIPGAVQAAVSLRGLMRGSGLKATVAAEGQTPSQADFLNSSLNSVSPEYFETMRIPLLAGRLFRRSKDEDPNARVVTRAFVERFFPGVADPVGRRFGIGALRRLVTPDYVIIGVVEDVKYRGLREPIHPQVFSCLCSPKDFSAESDFQIEVRTSGDPRALIRPMMELLHRLDPQLPFAEIHTLADEVETTIWQERVVARLATGFGVAAAILAGLGLYGMLSFLLAQQLREAGIRRALGARNFHIARWLGQWIAPVSGFGILAGVAAAWWGSGPLIGELLWDTSPKDPSLLLPAAIAVIGVVLVATWAPLRRATSVDPARVLREDA